MPAPDPNLEPLAAEIVRSLAALEAYPDDPTARRTLKHVQTHISHVFLTAERVYKLRKAVDLGFLCFATRAQRNADCLRELALNRRLAPDVYLGLAPIVATDGGFHVGPTGEKLHDGNGAAPEHCVVMRRLPDGADALSRLGRGALGPEHLERVAVRVARFHQEHRLDTANLFSTEAWLERCTAPAEENLRLLAGAEEALDANELLAEVRERSHAFVREHAGRFERRRRAGRGADGHGDLHLQHVWFETDRAAPLVIDCIEFNEALRRIDVACEVAFLDMDLRYRHAEALADFFLRTYARESDDFDLYGVVDYFASYRAAVRAKVASIAAADPEIEPDQRERAAASARRHLDLAARTLRPRETGTLVAMGGTVGTGKSTLANALADETGGVVIASDRVRKRLFGIALGERAAAPPGRGIYTPEHTERTYAALLERAEPVLRSGRTAILDATFASRRRRDAARAFARELGVEAHFVEARCAREVALERLARREAEGRDPSDAGPALYDRSVEHFEPPTEWPEAQRAAVDTGRADWRETLHALAGRLR